MERTTIEPAGAAAVIGRGLIRTGQASRRFARNQPLGAVALLGCAIIVLTGAFAPLIDRYEPTSMIAADRLQGPSATHWFGTDDAGRDTYSRLVHGARVSLYVGFFSVALGTSLGYLLGIFSGYVGGKTDIFLQRLIDAMLAFPSLLFGFGSGERAGGRAGQGHRSHQHCLYSPRRPGRPRGFPIGQGERIRGRSHRNRSDSPAYNDAPHPTQLHGAFPDPGFPVPGNRHTHRSFAELPGAGRAAASSFLGTDAGGPITGVWVPVANDGDRSWRCYNDYGPGV